MRLRISLSGNNRTMFLFGLFLIIATLIMLVFLSLYYQNIFLQVFGVIVASLTGGRSAAILTGLELKLHHLLIVLTIFTINLAWLCTMFPLLVTFYHHLTDIRFIGNMLASTRERAESEKQKIVIWGSWTLPFFVWLPFPFTGSFAGAVIGFLMGMTLKRILVLVVSSMAVGVISWTYGFQYFIVVTGNTGKFITYGILILLIINTYWQNRHRFLKKSDDEKTK